MTQFKHGDTKFRMLNSEFGKTQSENVQKTLVSTRRLRVTRRGFSCSTFELGGLVPILRRKTFCWDLVPQRTKCVKHDVLLIITIYYMILHDIIMHYMICSWVDWIISSVFEFCIHWIACLDLHLTFFLEKYIIVPMFVVFTKQLPLLKQALPRWHRHLWPSTLEVLGPSVVHQAVSPEKIWAYLNQKYSS